jgi:hypothetical protein
MPKRAYLALATAAIGLAGCIYAPPPVPVTYNTKRRPV